MKYSFFVPLILSFFLLIACNSNSESDYNEKEKSKNADADNKVDLISGHSREDLMHVFINEICSPIDSLYNKSVNQIMSFEVTSDYNSDMQLVNQAVDLIDFKSDKLEKFKVYQVDLNCKSMMLEYLKQYRGLLLNYYLPIARYKSGVENLFDIRELDPILFEQLERKLFEHNELFDVISQDYYYHHTRT